MPTARKNKQKKREETAKYRSVGIASEEWSWKGTKKSTGSNATESGWKRREAFGMQSHLHAIRRMHLNIKLRSRILDWMNAD